MTSTYIHTSPISLLCKLSQTLVLNSKMSSYIISSVSGEMIEDILMTGSELIRLCVRRINASSKLILFCCSFLVENKRSPGFQSDMAFTVILCKWGIQLQVTTVLAESLWLVRQQCLFEEKRQFKTVETA